MNSVGGRSRRRTTGALIAICGVLALVGCRSGSVVEAELAPLDESPIFSSSEYGVPVSPRVTNLRQVPRGGGREQVGKPYQVRGKWYHPREEPGYVREGTASWYGSNFHGRLTANGEVYDMYHLSAAHPTFPLPSYARVTNQTNGRSILVRVNDRGPYAHGRVVDVSQRTAEVLGFRDAGTADVKVEYVGRAPLEGDDAPMLMASLTEGAAPTQQGLPTGVMVASNTVSSDLVTAVSYNGSTVSAGAPPVQASSAVAAAIRRGLPTGAPARVEPAFAPQGDVPLPTLRASVLSFAPTRTESGAFRALAEITSRRETSAERIEIGTLASADLLLRVRAIAAGQGDLLESEGASFSLALAPGADADVLLQRLWQNGLTDAFVLRD